MPQINPVRLTVAEAAKLFGVEQKTIRRGIKQGHIRYVVIRGRYRINFDSLLAWSQSRAKIGNKLASQGIGQFVEKWKIRNKLFSPNPATLENKQDKQDRD